MVYVDLPEEVLRPDNVRDALAGHLTGVSPMAALKLLPGLDISATDQVAILREAVGDDGLAPYVRAAAVRASLHRAGQDAVPTLVEALESGEERIAAAAAAALGQVGDPEHLAALRRLRQSAATEPARRRAAFAETLIVHRFGLTGVQVPLGEVETQPAPVAIGAASFIGGRPGTERRRRALDGIRRELPWLEAARQDVYEVQCGPRLMEIAIDRDFAGPDGLRALTERPALPAVVAFASPEDDDFYPGLLVLSRPGGDERVGLVVTRLGGEPAYVAEGTLEHGEAVFDLRSAHAPGIAAVTSRIRVTGPIGDQRDVR